MNMEIVGIILAILCYFWPFPVVLVISIQLWGKIKNRLLFIIVSFFLCYGAIFFMYIFFAVANAFLRLQAGNPLTISLFTAISIIPGVVLSYRLAKLFKKEVSPASTPESDN